MITYPLNDVFYVWAGVVQVFQSLVKWDRTCHGTSGLSTLDTAMRRTSVSLPLSSRFRFL